MRPLALQILKQSPEKRMANPAFRTAVGKPDVFDMIALNHS
jgi:hypothetical protein